MLSNCDLVSNVSPLLIFCRYQMKCKSVSNVSPRYMRQEAILTTTQPLPHILLLTHGGWGQPLCNSLRMVTGEIKGVTEIALMPVDTLGEFYQRVEAVVKTLPEGSLILTDFVGGTTSNVAARLSADYPVAVIAGLNASLLLEALDRREQGMLTACVDELVEAGRSSCLDVVAHVRQLQQSL